MKHLNRNVRVCGQRNSISSAFVAANVPFAAQRVCSLERRSALDASDRQSERDNVDTVAIVPTAIPNARAIADMPLTIEPIPTKDPLYQSVS